VDITGYYHEGVRDYDPVAGQWLSYDPVRNAGDPNGFSMCGGDPVNYFDPDGRLGKQYGEFMYNGGTAGYGLRSLASLYNQFGAARGNTYLSWSAYNNASLLNLAAGMVTPSSYVNGWNSLQNRAENVMTTEYLNGSGGTWTAAQGLSSIVGDAVGYNGIYEGSFGVDRQSGTMLGGADRWSRGLMGGSQLILTGVGLKASYQPGMSSTAFLNNFRSMPFDPQKLAVLQNRLEAQGVKFVTEEEGAGLAAPDEARYIPRVGGPGTIALGPNPSRTAVIEEVMHYGQDRGLGFPGYTAAERNVLEIQAQNRLLQQGLRSGWTWQEMFDIRQAKKFWESQPQ
jgi:hypothetical protein